MQQNEKKDSVRWIIGTGLSLLSICVSFLLALSFCYLVGNVFQGLGGRNIHLLGVSTGILIGLTTIGLIVKRRVTAGQMVAALIMVEGLVIVLIGYFVGTWSVDRFTGIWFLGINLYIAIPCLAGLVIAWLILRMEDYRSADCR